MNTNDEVKFVYLQSGQTPATPDAGTVYFNPTTKDISVGDVSFKSQPEVLIYHGTISSDQTQITFDKTRTEIIDEIKDYFGRYYDTHKEVIIVGFWRDGYSSNDYIFRLNNVYWGSTDITLMFETYIRSSDGALGTTTIYKKIELDPSTTSSTASITTKTVYDNPLPYVTSADNGKVLGVTNKSWGTMDIPNELPSVTTEDNGKVAGVVDGNWDTMDIPNELPAVTSADNGSVLQVVNGAWAKASQSKGVMVFKCTASSSTASPNLDNGKTIADLNAAFDNGYLVIVKEHNNEYIMVEKLANGRAILIKASYQSGVGSISYLIGSSTTSSNLNLYTTSTVPVPIRTNSILRGVDGKWVEEFDRVPTVSAADNGNVLSVVNGAWAKSAPVSPVAVFSVTFADWDSDTHYYQHVYWGANDNTHEIVEGVSEYCAELDQAMADGKAIIIKAFVGDRMYNTCNTSVAYMDFNDKYWLNNIIGKADSSGQFFYGGLNGGWETFRYQKTGSSNKDGKFTAQLLLSLT